MAHIFDIRPAAALAVLTVLFLLVQGCGVPKEEYEKLDAQRQKLQGELEDTKTRLGELEKKVAGLDQATQALGKEMETLREEKQALEKSKAALTEQVETYTNLIRENVPTINLDELDEPEDKTEENTEEKTEERADEKTNELVEYEVKSKESLWTIARDHGVTVDSLKAANNLQDEKIKTGQKLRIPVKAE